MSFFRANVLPHPKAVHISKNRLVSYEELYEGKPIITMLILSMRTDPHYPVKPESLMNFFTSSMVYGGFLLWIIA